MFPHRSGSASPDHKDGHRRHKFPSRNFLHKELLQLPYHRGFPSRHRGPSESFLRRPHFPFPDHREFPLPLSFLPQRFPHREAFHPDRFFPLRHIFRLSTHRHRSCVPVHTVFRSPRTNPRGILPHREAFRPDTVLLFPRKYLRGNFLYIKLPFLRRAYRFPHTGSHENHLHRSALRLRIGCLFLHTDRLKPLRDIGSFHFHRREPSGPRRTHRPHRYPNCLPGRNFHTLFLRPVGFLPQMHPHRPFFHCGTGFPDLHRVLLRSFPRRGSFPSPHKEFPRRCIVLPQSFLHRSMCRLYRKDFRFRCTFQPQIRLHIPMSHLRNKGIPFPDTDSVKILPCILRFHSRKTAFRSPHTSHFRTALYKGCSRHNHTRCLFP